MGKRTFASRTFAARTFRSNTWRGAGENGDRLIITAYAVYVPGDDYRFAFNPAGFAEIYQAGDDRRAIFNPAGLAWVLRPVELMEIEDYFVFVPGVGGSAIVFCPGDDAAKVHRPGDVAAKVYRPGDDAAFVFDPGNVFAEVFLPGDDRRRVIR